jgi:hypothetical protein
VIGQAQAATTPPPEEYRRTCRTAGAARIPPITARAWPPAQARRSFIADATIGSSEQSTTAAPCSAPTDSASAERRRDKGRADADVFAVSARVRPSCSQRRRRAGGSVTLAMSVTALPSNGSVRSDVALSASGCMAPGPTILHTDGTGHTMRGRPGLARGRRDNKATPKRTFERSRRLRTRCLPAPRSRMRDARIRRNWWPSSTLLRLRRGGSLSLTRPAHDDSEASRHGARYTWHESGRFSQSRQWMAP